MKAWVAEKQGSYNNIKQVELEKPIPGIGELLVAVKGAAINPADVKLVKGISGAGFIHSTKPPIRFGYDFSGVIEEKGPEVTKWSKGDEVYGFLPYSSGTKLGSFAEYILVDPDQVAKKPESITHTQAASVPTVACTAYQSLVDIAVIKAGHKVLINGASGGVGSYAVQIAKGYQAEVWATASQNSIPFVKDLGADQTIDYKQKKLTGLTERFDIVYDVASNYSYGKCKHLLNKGGTYITLLPDFSFITGKLSALFSSKNCKMCIVKSKPETLDSLRERIDQKRIKVPIDSTYPVTQLVEALEKLEKGGVKGKIAIEMMMDD